MGGVEGFGVMQAMKAVKEEEEGKKKEEPLDDGFGNPWWLFLAPIAHRDAY